MAYQGLRKAAFRATKEEARDAEAALLGELKARDRRRHRRGPAAGDAAPAPRVLRRGLGRAWQGGRYRGPGRRDRACARAAPARAPRPAGEPDRRGGDIRLPAGPRRAVRHGAPLGGRGGGAAGRRRRRQGRGPGAGRPGRAAGRHEAQHDQPGPPDPPGGPEAGPPGLPLPARRLPPGGRDARPLAPAGGGAAPRGGAPAALPRDREAGGADPHAALGDPDAAPRGRAPRARRGDAAAGEGRARGR